MFRTLAVVGLTCFVFLTVIQAQDAPKKFMVYFGTYTGDKNSPSEGIYRCELDLATGKLSEPKLASKAVDPFFQPSGTVEMV